MTFDPINFTVAAPLLALAAGALVILLLDLLLPAKQAQPWWYIFGAGSVGVASYYVWNNWGTGLKGFGGAMVWDQLAQAFAVVLLLTTFLTILLAVTRSESDKSGYLALLLWAAMGMLVMVSAGNLLTIFLGLEILSLALYVAVAYDPARQQAKEAALKYFVLGSAASGFILFGFALIYGVTGTMDLALLTKASMAAGGLYYKVGIGMALVGFAFKLALVPFHAWAPDVYQGAPTPTTAFMSVGTKTAAFAVLGRFLLAVLPPINADKYLLPLAVVALLSMIGGSTVGIWQNDLKRLMAYSGIANAGYLIMAIVGLQSGGMTSAAYYMAAYAFTAMGIFAVILRLEADGVEGSTLSGLSGLYYKRPALAAAMSLFMFALVGLPPAGGFMGKFMLAKAAVAGISAGPLNAWLVLIGLFVSSGISAYVYLRVIGAMFKKPAEEPAALMAGAEEGPLAFSKETVTYAVEAVLVIAVVGTIWLGLFPGGVVSLLSTAIGK